METYWKIVAALGTALSLIAIGIAVATWTLDIRGRLTELENRVNLVVTSPTITRKDSGPGYSQPIDYSAKDEGWGTVPNPLIATCIDLIKRTATAREKDSSLTLPNALESLQRTYDCEGLLKGLSKKP
jgi:hypothetical protein